MSEVGKSLIHSRLAYQFGFARPGDSERTAFGMFPRHGGYFIGLWSTVLATVVGLAAIAKSHRDRGTYDKIEARLDAIPPEFLRQLREGGPHVIRR